MFRARPFMSKLPNFLYIALGWLSLALGVIGIFLPLLPTTPFVLLSAWCFSKSSPRFHKWLMEHKLFGKIIRAWRDNEGLETKTKIRIVIVTWIPLCISMYLVGNPWLIAMLICIGIGVSYKIFSLPTLQSES